MEREIALSDRMRLVIERLEIRPIDPSHAISMQSRLVHDLGICGDDWGEFYSFLSHVYKSTNPFDAHYIPPEFSHDTRIVLSCRMWPVYRISW